MSHSRGSHRGNRSRRRTEWFGGVGGTAVQSFSSSGTALLGSGIITTTGEETLARTRGILDIFLTAGTSAGDGYFGAVGIGLATTSAFQAGVASLPTPITESGWDGWLWHQFYSVHIGIAASADSDGSHFRTEIDSKAMRKVDTSMTLYAAIEHVEIGTAVMSVFLDTRMLSFLP